MALRRLINTKAVSVLIDCIWRPYSITHEQYNVLKQRPAVRLSREDDDLIMAASVACQMETTAKKKVVNNFFSFKIEPDPVSKDFVYCVLVGTRFAKVQGHLTKKFLALFEGVPFYNDVEYVFNSCKSEDKPFYVDTLYEEVSCFFEKSPFILTEHGVDDDEVTPPEE